MDLSVAAQLRALRDYADKNGYLVVREYIDEAESGRIADRPQFRKMLDEASKPEAPFREILVWKFSRFTRKREHAVAFKSMLRRKDIRVVSITEHADDTPTGNLMEAIIESVDEFYSENLAQEVAGYAGSRLSWLLDDHQRPLRLPAGYGPGQGQEAPPAGTQPTPRRRGTAHLRPRPTGQDFPGHPQDPERRWYPLLYRKAVEQDHRPQGAHQRSLHRNPGVGTKGPGRPGTGSGGERFPRHRVPAGV